MTEEKACEVCGGPVAGCGYVLSTLCSPDCYRVHDDRKRQESDRQTVKAWEKLNRGIPDGTGFFIPYLEDARGRFRPWWKLPYMRDLAKEYRIHERIAALRDKGRQEPVGAATQTDAECHRFELGDFVEPRRP